MSELAPHVWQVGLLLLGAWVAFLQRRSAKISELEVRVVKLESASEAAGKTLEKLEKKIEEVCDNMLRRGDVELIRSMLH